ncbi:FKBP-type peptidyl-prolyl cis-trans isomerase [Cellvibrio sp. PSBB023]|uniref:FKBP-type peptidyl-prolyl cis-trans isomerase n=1 Tax=Cellvibrio sp. PSBB023 TaxID=1945512 RepID=UPI00098E9EE3|nr:FKBP-type peptidyl-prolyl cis-trans isomerase [Cellvibrio sp. PSBB023]AQT60304.1 peptidylprolyl isomerase [Cellvibrio sp. PSBB023]
MSKQYSSVEDLVSYGIGRQMGEQLASNPFDGVSPEAVAQGVIDALNGVAMPYSNEEMQAAFEEINTRMQAQAAEKHKVLASAGEAFLAENAKKAGITVTASGLQYEVITQGSGAVPTATSKVKTHYHGTLIDGTVFDSSVNRGQPIDFPVNGVIAGWTEALQLMPVGSKWRLYVPHNLAYGERGAGASIAPFSTLIFDVELIDIVG